MSTTTPKSIRLSDTKCIATPSDCGLRIADCAVALKSGPSPQEEGTVGRWCDRDLKGDDPPAWSVVRRQLSVVSACRAWRYYREVIEERQ
jgi:hypothetical protein